MYPKIELIKALRMENPNLSLLQAKDLAESEEMSHRLAEMTDEIFQKDLDELTETIYANSVLQLRVCADLAHTLLRRYNFSKKH